MINLLLENSDFIILNISNFFESKTRTILFTQVILMKEGFEVKDIYFDKNYGVLCEEIENGKSEVYEFNHPLGKIKHLFIKREIPISIDGETYFDIITPYGYGGPIILENREEKAGELIWAYKEAFQDYCKANKIVCEFIRFHPVLKNAEDFKDYYEIANIRKTVGTNLKVYEDPVQKEFSKSTRKNIRKALEAGVEFTIQVHPAELKEFKEIYYSTMRRNNADSYYYFDDSYFERCIELFGENIVLSKVIYEGTTIGMGLSFVYGKTLHTKLSGTLEEYHHLYPAYILQYAITVWGKENGIELIHDGGGRTNSEEDSLYKFKKQFGKNTSFDFQTGRKIWDENIYAELCEQTGADVQSEFFPAYRNKIRNEVKSG